MVCVSAQKKEDGQHFPPGKIGNIMPIRLRVVCRSGLLANARVYHQESNSLNQATSQRLRWSSGRFSIARTLGVRLLTKGIREKNGLSMPHSLCCFQTIH